MSRSWVAWSPEEVENLRRLGQDRRKSWYEIAAELNALHPERPARSCVSVQERAIRLNAPPRSRKDGTPRALYGSLAAAKAEQAKAEIRAQVSAATLDGGSSAGVNAAWVALAVVREEGRAEGRAEGRVEGRAEGRAEIIAAIQKALARFLPDAAAEPDAEPPNTTPTE